MVLINLHRNLHEKSSFLSEIMFIQINPYVCHYLTCYQSNLSIIYERCVRKKGVPIWHNLFYDIFSLIYLSKPHRKYQEFLKKHLMNFLKRLTGLKNFLKDLGYILDCFLPVSQYMPLNLHMILSVDKHSDIDTNAIIDKAIKRYFVQPV